MSDRSDLPWFRPLDAVLALLIVAAAFYAGWSLPEHGEGTVAIVNCRGSEDTLALPLDTVFSVNGRMGDVQVEMHGFRARIASSPCPGQDCVRTGWLKDPGQAAVCMPSEVMVRLESRDGSGSAPDVVTY